MSPDDDQAEDAADDHAGGDAGGDALSVAGGGPDRPGRPESAPPGEPAHGGAYRPPSSPAYAPPASHVSRPARRSVDPAEVMFARPPASTDQADQAATADRAAHGPRTDRRPGTAGADEGATPDAPTSARGPYRLPARGAGTSDTSGTAARTPRTTRRTETREERSSRRGRQLLATGCALLFLAVTVVVAVVVSAGTDGGGPDLGRVTAVTGAPVARPPGAGEGEPLADGDTVRDGWVVETAGDDAVAVELPDGGVVRFDLGARVGFSTTAVPGAPEQTVPSLSVTGGRLWVNPAATDAARSVVVQAPGASISSAGRPLALDCTEDCTVEAPAGGVTVVAAGRAETTPGPREPLVLAADGWRARRGTAPSAWTDRNLADDATADLPDDEAAAEGGILASARFNGTYTVDLSITGPPTGDPIPEALRHPTGAAYDVAVTADASACDAADGCTALVATDDGASGTAVTSAGEVSLEFSQPVDCYNEDRTAVVRPRVGSTAVHAALTVTEAVETGGRWRVSAFTGAGTVDVTLDQPCNRGDTLGAASAPVTLTTG